MAWESPKFHVSPAWVGWEESQMIETQIEKPKTGTYQDSGEHLIKFEKEHTSRNKGRKMSEKNKQILLKCNIGNKYALGKKRSEETKRKISEAFKGRIPWIKGKHHSEETKRKIGLANEKNNRPDLAEYNRKYKPEQKGLKSPNFGKKSSLETRMKIALHHADFRGENGPNWQGGLSFEPYGIEFNDILKGQIRTRDNFCCQECGYPESELEERLNIHHIDYDKRNNDPNNLISLCRLCHLQTNFDRDDWTNYFQNKIGV